MRVLAILALGIACTGSDPEETEVEADIDADFDGVVAALDCDDNDPARHPGADEICDGIDNDCDDEIDEGAVDATAIFYPDGDGDGFGTDNAPVLACERPAGFVSQGGDCDDADETRFPGQPELCNDVDDDCDLEVDEDAVDATTFFYVDRDGDGVGDEDVFEIACSAPAGFVAPAGDCDDLDDTRFPGADEVCNGIDEDCDDEIDENAIDAPTFFPDADFDSYGDDGNPLAACEMPFGYVARGGDCNDLDRFINPDATEFCDGIDTNCNGQPDDQAVNQRSSYLDGDGDGFGDPATEMMACEIPVGRIRWGGDCNDADPSIFPGAAEPCDGIDNDCDNAVDDFTVPTRFPTISDAVAAVTPDSEICVRQGTYSNEFNVSDRQITLIGVDGANRTFLDISTAGQRLVTANYAFDLTMRGFTVTGLAPASIPNRAEGRFLSQSFWDENRRGRLVLEDVHFEDIEVRYQQSVTGGLVTTSYADVTYRDVTVSNVDVYQSNGTSFWDIRGGLFWADNGDVVVNNLAIDNASVMVDSSVSCVIAGGMLLFTGADYTTTINDLTIEESSTDLQCNGGSSRYRGGLVLVVADVINGSNWRVERNVANVQGTSVVEGSLVRFVGDTALDGFDLTLNQRDFSTPGQATVAGAIEAFGPLRLDRLRASQNTLDVSAFPATIRGSLLYVTDTTDLRWIDARDNVVGFGQALLGGLLYADQSALSVTNGIFAGNTSVATSTSGGIIYADLTAGSGSLSLDNIDVVSNTITATATAGGAVFWLEGGMGTLAVANSSFVDNQVLGTSSVQGPLFVADDASCTWGHTNVFQSTGPTQAPPCTPSAGSLSVAPGYTDVAAPDPVAWDLRLGSGSLLIDAGDPTVTDADGSRSDIGAYGGPLGQGW